MRTAEAHLREPVDRAALDCCFDELETLLALRIRQAVGRTPAGAPATLPSEVRDDGTPFSRFVRERGLGSEELLLLLIALAPWVRPYLFDQVVGEHLPTDGNLEIIGGTRGKQHRSFLPTGDTVLFILAGSDLRKRLYWQSQLLGDAELIRQGLVRLEAPVDREPPMSGRFDVDSNTAELLLTGAHRAPRLSPTFPAQPLSTSLPWEYLVLPAQTLQQLEELKAWMAHGKTLMDDWGMREKLRPGCRALFHGPPGTGKTLTATLLGRMSGRQVYRVDLSMVVSKYIGETEKNLDALFDKAQHKDWIMFFDEADALFGKRSQVRDARDRYANQEISFLLQRIELFDGLAILASNLSNNVDEAFSRRFEHMIQFPMPKSQERLALWRNSLPTGIALERGVDVAKLATRYELSGGMIINVVRHACLQSIARGEAVLRNDDLLEGIRREFLKDNRVE